MEPILFAYVGIACMTGMAGLGSVYGLTICGKTVLGAMKKAPEKLGTYIALSALPSSQGLYGFIGYMYVRDYLVTDISWISASALFGAGLLMGFANIFSGIRQGEVCAEGVAATAAGHNVFAATMVMAVFPEFYAILSLVVTILIAGTIA